MSADEPCDPLAAVYDAEFFAARCAGARASAAVVAPVVADLVSPAQVIDVGGGTGTWMRAFADLGCDVWGIDGAHVPREQLEIASSRFIERDFTSPLNVDGTWDLAVSLEVAEHLPPSSARPFSCGLARLAPVLLFSAAIPNQGGRHHVNEQWPAYWVALFEEFAMTPIDCIRPLVWDDPRGEWWYAQNTLIFVREALLPRYPKLMAKRETSGERVLPLVHPRLYLEPRAHREVREGTSTSATG